MFLTWITLGDKASLSQLFGEGKPPPSNYEDMTELENVQRQGNSKEQSNYQPLEKYIKSNYELWKKTNHAVWKKLHPLQWHDGFTKIVFFLHKGRIAIIFTISSVSLRRYWFW